MGGNILIIILVFIGILAGIFAGLMWLGGGATLPLSIFFCTLCLIMILFILIQKPKGGGLSGAFGGSGGGQAAVFGAKTGDMLTVATVICFVLFISLGIGLVYSTRADVAGETTPEITSDPAAENPLDTFDPEGMGLPFDPADTLPADIPVVTTPADAPADAPAETPATTP